MDFVHDQLFDGRKIRILTIVDTVTRVSPAIEVRQQFRGADVVNVLERVNREIGYPKTIRLDNVLSGDARALFGQQVSFAGVPPVDQQ
jgi:putative transposase